MSAYIHTEDIHNIKAAEIILPIVFKLSPVNSIVDIGCGIGTWLSVASSLGISDLIGVDGDYVAINLLEKHLNLNSFFAADLSLPLDLDRKFDLALCLEVAEHLPESSGSTLVGSLINHSDLILFSAAIPLQGGQNHLNEQPPSYWIKKFEEHGYYVYDPIRHLVWDTEEVDVWYKQNTFLFSRKELALSSPKYTHIVHPELFRTHQLKKIQYQNELEKLKSGNGKPLFYLKRFFQSLIKSKG